MGISACLLGDEVRFDGGHKRDPFLTEVLGAHVEWVRVCPEVEVGMGTPREPLRLVRDAGRLRMMTIATGVDYTEAMERWARERVEELAAADLSGYVFKKDSPSCGMEQVKVLDAAGVPARDGRGLFADALMRRLPDLPVEDEGRLSNPLLRERFIERVLAHHRSRPRCATMSESVRRVPVTRVGRGPAGEGEDSAAVEEPLEVRLHGRPFAVIMRTPGSDRELAAGFLFAEGVISSADDIGAVEHCRHPDHPNHQNVVDVYLIDRAAREVERHLEQRRNVVASSSCGLCGRASIDSLRVRAEPLENTLQMRAAVAAELPTVLRSHQAAFDRTGGLHAAGLFTADGRCDSTAEDVGRHNAVDKIVGGLLLAERLPAGGFVLAVSGRTSFEIVQKAWLAGIELVCAVSAPSSLAIDLAEAAHITLLGFTRDGGFNIYSHPSRIARV